MPGWGLRMAKRKNHEVSKFYLKRWAHNGKIWMFDIQKQAIEERSTEATFAIHNHLYVPIINGVRDDSIEDWFGEAEDKLAAYLQRLDKRDLSRGLPADSYLRIVFALVGLGYRSGYELKLIEKLLQEDETLRSQMGIDDESNLEVVALENLINIVTMQAKSCLNLGMGVMCGLKFPLLTCERPGFDMAQRGFQSFVIPLGPYELALIDRDNPVGVITTTQSEGSKSFVDLANRFTISRARSWVVANDPEILEAIAGELTKEKVAERAATDSVKFTPLSDEERAAGWSLYKG